MKIFPAVIATSLVLLAGCENAVSYAPIIHPSHPLASRSVESVEVLAVTPPSRPHTDIGILQVVGGAGGDGTTAGLIATARENAARLGCDAILVTSIELMGGRYHRPNIQASCILYGDAP